VKWVLHGVLSTEVACAWDYGRCAMQPLPCAKLATPAPRIAPQGPYSRSHSRPDVVHERLQDVEPEDAHALGQLGLDGLRDRLLCQEDVIQVQLGHAGFGFGGGEGLVLGGVVGWFCGVR